MKNDGLCWLHIPVDVTDPFLTESAAQLINSQHQLLGRPLVAAGQRNPYYDVITQIGVALGSDIDRSTPLAACGPVNRIDRVPLSLIDLLIGIGGEVEGLPVWFELTVDPATVDCPFSTTEPKEKWSTWGTFGQSHLPQKLGANWYRSSAVGESGELMNASQWVTLSRSNTISLAQFREIQSANSQGPI